MKQNSINNESMFTIDLLKGQGIPSRNKPIGAAIVLITSVVPLLIAISLCGLHWHSKVVTRLKQHDIQKLAANISQLSDAVAIKRDMERKKSFYNTCLTEVKSSIGKFTQWSPVMSILIEEMPASVILTGLEVEHERMKKPVSNNNQSNSAETKDVTVTKLVLQVSNQGQGDYGKQIKDFRERLYASPVLGSKLDKIDFSRKAVEKDGMETISYQIECLFKQEL
ncbi:MAG: hypothetical protein JW787_14405 [Sedimentisphaerales bacterium]|nr:hypothetical protein [Sedimentisphaerales bacterium]